MRIYDSALDFLPPGCGRAASDIAPFIREPWGKRDCFIHLVSANRTNVNSDSELRRSVYLGRSGSLLRAAAPVLLEVAGAHRPVMEQKVRRGIKGNMRWLDGFLKGQSPLRSHPKGFPALSHTLYSRRDHPRPPSGPRVYATGEYIKVDVFQNHDVIKDNTRQEKQFK